MVFPHTFIECSIGKKAMKRLLIFGSDYAVRDIIDRSYGADGAIPLKLLPLSYEGASVCGSSLSYSTAMSLPKQQKIISPNAPSLLSATAVRIAIVAAGSAGKR